MQITQRFLIVAITAIGLPALANTAPQTVMETITVTASKREGDANEIPASISVLDEFFIEDQGIESTEEMTRFVPNLYYKKAASGDAFVCRGISTIDTSLFSPMGFYVDDVPQTLSFTQDYDLFNVERVEVLRGPQSTLYGKNSSSGVINVVIAQPDNETKGKIVTGIGDYNTWKVGAMASGPILEDHLYFGLSVSKDETDGYLENVLTGDNSAGEQSNLSARGTLRWTPTERMDVSLVLNGTDNDEGIAYLRYESGPYATDEYEIYSNIDDRAEQDTLGQSLRWKYRFDWAELLSITSHQNFNRSHKMDLDRTPVDLGYSANKIEQDAWGQEFRLTSNDEGRLTWLTGLYFSREELDNDWALNHIMSSIAYEKISTSNVDTAAAFGQATIAVTEKLDATAGLRLDHYSADGNQNYTTSTSSLFYEANISETELLPTASLSYSFTDAIRGYLLFSTGWLAGGYDYFTATSKDNFVYGPEYTKNYEVGLKSSFLEDRLHANVSFFYTEIDDKQIKEWDTEGGLAAWTITNAAQAHTTGVELEVRATPWRNIEFFAGIGYTSAEIDEWGDTGNTNTVDHSGNQLPWAPDLTVNVGMGYYADNGWYGTTSLFWAGTQYFDAANTMEDDGYVLVDLKVGYRFKSFDISLFCKNLLDETYALRKANMGGDMILVEDSQPRTVGAKMIWRF